MRNGRSRMRGVSFRRSHATEYIFDTSMISSIDIVGRIERNAFASIVLPLHGGHWSITLCHPAAAIRSARFAWSCQRIDEKSTHTGLRVSRISSICLFSEGATSFSHVRIDTSSARDSTPMISTSGMMTASFSFSFGMNMR